MCPRRMLKRDSSILINLSTSKRNTWLKLIVRIRKRGQETKNSTTGVKDRIGPSTTGTSEKSH